MTKYKITPSFNREFNRFSKLLMQIGLLVAALTLVHRIKLANGESKEFDWSELGVSLASPKSHFSNIGGSGLANNLRILVSPQRRASKSYDFDYTNNSQPISSQGVEATYVIPGSPGGSYVSQTSSGHSSPHSSAYSALSASLATLKNRLNARGVTLSSPLSDGGSQSSIYQGASLSDSHQAGIPQSQSQPTYLSVTNQQDQQSASVNGYSSGAQSHQNNDNKTIVLAIPAKINFLTDGRSSSNSKQQVQQQTQQQQAQQLTVIQPSNDQQVVRNEYSTAKQLGMINTQDGVVDNTGQTGSDHEHHQYVIVNSPATSSDSHSTLVASNLGTNGLAQTSGPLYTNIYPTLQSSQYAVKYIPSYPQSIIQPQTVPKLYSTVSETSGAHDTEPAGRFASCLDTCNSLDSRWKKFSTSKYRSCCSRSAQYDAQYDQTSSDKASDSSYKYADDAYYSYLYRKSRGRRARRTHRGRYHRYSPSTASLTPSSDDDGASGDSGGESSRPSSGRSYNHYEVSPYMKYYKSRQPSAAIETTDTSREGQDIAIGGKYSSRSHRRGRGRELDSPSDSQQSHDLSEDEGPESLRSSAGYGSGEYSVDAERFPDSRNSRLNEDDETRAPGFDEPVDQDSVRSGQVQEGSDHTAEQAPIDVPEEAEPETTTSYKYTPSRRRKYNKSRARKSQSGKDSKVYKKSRKGRFNKQEQATSQNINGTESSAQNDHNQEQAPTNDQEDQLYQKDTTANEGGDAEKEVLSLANKYRASLNDSAVANLSKTTMQLKEILSILEKKAQLKANESTPVTPYQQATSTPAPATTTSFYSSSIYNSPSYGSSSLQSALASGYLDSSDLNLKSPYRYEPSSLSSMGSSSLSLPSAYSSLSSDAFSSIPGYGASHYSLATQKHVPMPGNNLPRKRRGHKNVRPYNNMMIPKSHNLHASPSSIIQTGSKSNFLNPYYSLQYPYWYSRGSSPQVTSSYPYRNLMKNPYSSLLNGSAKLAAAATGAHYSDESRVHSLSYDPLSNVASSLRPATMRLRSKPFVFQPHVLPIYTRHTILTQPVDVKKK